MCHLINEKTYNTSNKNGNDQNNNDDVKLYGSWGQKVVTKHEYTSRGSQEAKESDGKRNELGTEETAEETTDNKDGTSEWSNSLHVLLEWEGSSDACVL